MGDEGFVVAFELNPHVFYWLKNNIKLNKARNVLALPIALGDENKFVELYCVTKGNIEASSMIYNHVYRKLRDEVQEFKAVKVPMYRLGDLFNVLNLKFFKAL